jgi:hypothetical protein
VLLSEAHQQGAFTNQVIVALRTAWYPSSSSGPATVTVSLKDRATGSKYGSQQSTILPEQWHPNGCVGATRVGYVEVQVQGPDGAETVSFTLRDQSTPTGE